MQVSMSEEAREARREYMRDWRGRNPDKVRAYNARYWRKKAAERASERQKVEDSGSGGVQ